MTISPVEDTIPEHGLGWWTLAAGVTFAGAALIVAPVAGLTISTVFDNQQGQVTWLTLFAGVFLTGCFFWWLLMARPRRFSLRRGAVAGVLVALFSYPVVLALAEIFQRGWSAGITGDTTIERLVNVLMLTALTLLTTGFAATLLMAGAGMVMVLGLLLVHPDAKALGAKRERRQRGGLIGGLLTAVTVLASAVVLFLLAIFAFLTLIPLDKGQLAQPRPASAPSTYQSAIAAYEAVAAEEAKLPLHPRCRSTLLTHGSKVGRVVVFFHGLTNCPAQADELAPKLFDLGYNVYVPRLPGHGEADPLTLALADVTAEDFAENAGQSVDIAQGLGEEVIVLGLSAGGTMTSWLGQYSAETDDSISLAPFLGPHIVPSWATHAATNLLLMLPNAMVWWNPAEPESAPEMDYAYPRYATHALAQVMRLGAIVNAGASAQAPLAKKLGMLINDADVAVSNALARQVIAGWQGHGATVNVEVLPLSRRLPHDLIDPRQDGADVDFIYPLLIKMIDAPR